MSAAPAAAASVHEVRGAHRVGLPRLGDVLRRRSRDPRAPPAADRRRGRASAPTSWARSSTSPTTRRCSRPRASSTRWPRPACTPGSSTTGRRGRRSRAATPCASHWPARRSPSGFAAQLAGAGARLVVAGLRAGHRPGRRGAGAQGLALAEAPVARHPRADGGGGGRGDGHRRVGRGAPPSSGCSRYRSGWKCGRWSGPARRSAR